MVSSRRTNLRESIQRECVGGTARSFAAASSPPLPSSLEPAAAAALFAGAVRRRRSSTGMPASCRRQRGNFTHSCNHMLRRCSCAGP